MSKVILDCIGLALDGKETDNYSPRPRKTYRAGCNFVFRRKGGNMTAGWIPTRKTSKCGLEKNKKILIKKSGNHIVLVCLYF